MTVVRHAPPTRNLCQSLINHVSPLSVPPFSLSFLLLKKMNLFRRSELSTHLPNLSSSTGKWSATTTMRDADASGLSFPGRAAMRDSGESVCSCCRVTAPQQNKPEEKQKIKKPIISTPARPVSEDEQDHCHSRRPNRHSLFGSIRHLYVEKSQSLLLENTASVARDHLGPCLIRRV